MKDIRRNNRFYYLDNLKTFLTCLVVFHHVAIAFGGVGIFVVNSTTKGSLLFNGILSLIVAINQSYFMGLFFIISSFFSYFSLKRKGSIAFIKGKFKRLIIPSIIYFFIIAPLTEFIIGLYYSMQGLNDFSYTSSLNLGPLWFLVALFIFDLVFVLFHKIIKTDVYYKSLSSTKIVFSVIILSIITFAIRIVFPIGITIPRFGLQPAHIAQYIFAYAIGIAIAKNKWFTVFTRKKYMNNLWVAAGLVLLLFAFTSLTKDIESAFGGFNIISFLYCLWEQFMFILMSLGLLGLFYIRFNCTSKIKMYMSNNAFGAYFIHFIIISIIMITIDTLSLTHFVSFIITLSLSIILSFILGRYVRFIF